MSQANLYGFGRLAWDADLSSKQIIDDWTRLTFGSDSKLADVVNDIQLRSWRVFENYTGPLGLQTLTDIVGNHYGVSVEASERNGWGQWHRADENGVGMDRTVKTGTGFIGSTRRRWPAFTSRSTRCRTISSVHAPPAVHLPVEVGKDRHPVHLRLALRGRGRGRRLGARLEERSRKVDAERYAAILKQLEYQAAQAVVWRDAVARWFHRTSGSPMPQGRVGNYPGRLEAETAALDGYVPAPVTPWEAGSGDGAVECKAQKCTATFTITGEPGRYDVVVQYFDVNSGAARYSVRLPGRPRRAAPVRRVDRRRSVPDRRLDGGSSTRFILPNVALKPGDRIVVEGIPDGAETAGLDYVEIQKAGRRTSQQGQRQKDNPHQVCRKLRPSPCSTLCLLAWIVALSLSAKSAPPRNTARSPP
jgi:alpha-glucuronidase